MSCNSEIKGKRIIRRFGSRAVLWFLGGFGFIFFIFFGVLNFTPSMEGEKTVSFHHASGSVSHISDIHFNPFYDPSLAAQLIGSDVSRWESIFSGSKSRDLKSMQETETNYSFLKLSLEDMAKRVKSPDFIIFTGDFLPHDFDIAFKKVAKANDSYELFVKKTVAFMVKMFERYVPDTRVYFCLGNNDCDTGDYQIVPEGYFLKETAPVLSPLLKDRANQNSFSRTYPVGGYYAVSPNGSLNTVIISLNSNFFSKKYVIPASGDPGAKELVWLEKEVNHARESGRKVWLLLHIPPGANVYSSLSKKSYVPMWKPEYNNRFIEILRQHASVITAGFAGHTHMDDFRVLRPGSQPGHAGPFIHICPALSPQFGNNPGVVEYRYNRDSFRLTNFTVYFFNLGSTPTATSWQTEYDFKTAYGLKENDDITGDTIFDLYNRLNTSPETRSLYMKYYPVSSTSPAILTDDNWKSYWCGIGNISDGDYIQCSGLPVSSPQVK